jgi:hypothetical protein
LQGKIPSMVTVATLDFTIGSVTQI